MRTRKQLTFICFEIPSIYQIHPFVIWLVQDPSHMGPKQTARGSVADGIGLSQVESTRIKYVRIVDRVIRISLKWT